MYIRALILQRGRFRGFLGLLRIMGISVGVMSYAALPWYFLNLDMKRLYAGGFGAASLAIAFIMVLYLYKFPWYRESVFLLAPTSKFRLVLSAVMAAILTPSITPIALLALFYSAVFLDFNGSAGIASFYATLACLITSMMIAKVSRVSGLKDLLSYSGILLLVIPALAFGGLMNEIALPLFLSVTILNLTLLTKTVNQVTFLRNSPHCGWTGLSRIWKDPLVLKEFLLLFRHRKSRQQFIIGWSLQVLLLTVMTLAGAKMAVAILGMNMMMCLTLGEFFQYYFSADYTSLGVLRVSPYSTKDYVTSKLTLLRRIVLSFNLVASFYMTFVTTLPPLVIVVAINVVFLPHLVLLVSLHSYKSIDLDGSIFNYNSFRRPVKLSLLVGILGLLEITFCLLGPAIKVDIWEVIICLAMLGLALLAERRLYVTYERMYTRWLHRSWSWNLEVLSV